MKMDTKITNSAGQIVMQFPNKLPVANTHTHVEIKRVLVRDETLVIYCLPDDSKQVIHTYISLKNSREVYRIFYPQFGYQSEDGENIVCFNHLVSWSGIFITREVMDQNGDFDNLLIDFVFDARFKNDREVGDNLEKGYYDILPFLGENPFDDGWQNE
ncbi:hypothetical protein ACPT8I_08060 [Lactiplantibacillus plantarum]|uniref:hypothetical protein n=1 Tax=Lactiplantibacillus plantarum TaxID=1590 RepID=UPI0025736EA0|nr:hypothetical protein [Lactiplantibacillus plantarum]BEI48175.1 hypothetical protein IYO2065_26790 [Lactiplantibacillus plantarum]